MRTTLAVALVALVTACSGPDGADIDAVAPGDGAVDAPLDAPVDAPPDAPRCWLDCFPFVECHGDLLSHHPPAFWEGECGTGPETCPGPWNDTCAEGCRGEVAYYVPPGTVDYHWLCAPVRPAQVGGACVTDADCHPTYAFPETSNGLLHQDYLRCGPSGCEAAAAPVVPGYFLLCDATVTLTVPGPRWVEDPGRGAGAVCIQATDSCDRQAASITCDGDWACPARSYCDRAVLHVDGTDHGVGVCRPGPYRPLRASDLPCPG